MTGKEAFDNKRNEFQKKIDQIEYDYQYTRKILKLTIDLAEQYRRTGHAEAVLLQPIPDIAMFDKDFFVSEANQVPRIKMEPIVTFNSVQDVWNIWAEAHSVAQKCINPPLPLE